MKDVSPPRGRDAGAALAFVILIMLGLLALAHGALVASLSELAGSRAAVRDLEVRGAAEVGLQSALGSRVGPAMDSLGVWEARTTSEGVVRGVETLGIVRRLGTESWLVEGQGRIDEGMTARTMRMAWSLDPLTRVAELPGIVSVGPGAPVSLTGTVDASAPAGVVAPMQDGDCDPWHDALDIRYRATPVPLVTSVSDSSSASSLGLLDLEGLMALASVTVAGSGTPTPTETLGTCQTDEPWGWGDPDQPWRPCGSHLALRSARGDLVVNGGVGQGLLIVDGGLTLDGGARFFGLVIASGALRLDGGSRFEGMALAGGGLDVAPGTVLRGSACWAVRALSAQRAALDRLVPLGSLGRIGPF